MHSTSPTFPSAFLFEQHRLLSRLLLLLKRLEVRANCAHRMYHEFSSFSQEAAEKKLQKSLRLMPFVKPMLSNHQRRTLLEYTVYTN